jgi:peroxiredoxin
MSTLEAGAKAPEVSLNSTHNRSFSLDAERATRAAVLMAFFKVECPTCQYTFPFLQRIAQAYPREKVLVVGISQSPHDDTVAFARKYGVTFPVMLEDPKKYTASNAYGLTTVPSTFMVSRAGTVESATIGWDKKQISELNELVAKAAGMPPAPIFNAGENVLDFKAG